MIMVLFNRRNGMVHVPESTIESMQAELTMLRQEVTELRDWQDAIKRAWGFPEEAISSGLTRGSFPENHISRV